MKCPLGSTNKRFLLNTLRPCAAERRPGSRSPAVRGAEDGREDGVQGSRHRPEDSEYAYRKDTRHRRAHPPSRSQSSRPSDSSTSELGSPGHAPRHTNQSNRTRSRSPNRERLTTKKSTDRTWKWCVTISKEWHGLIYPCASMWEKQERGLLVRENANKLTWSNLNMALYGWTNLLRNVRFANLGWFGSGLP